MSRGVSDYPISQFLAAFLEQCKAEEESFRPFIHVQGETTMPNGITLFGISGGHRRTVKNILDNTVYEPIFR